MKKLMTKERLSAFLDAILAIIMTILVLELPKPAELSWAGIWELRTSYIAFAVSFFGLAVLWADWHREWHDVKAITEKTVWSMIIVVFFMAFMPYLTGLLASDIFNPVGQILYGSDLLLIVIFNSAGYRSLASIEANKAIRPVLIARANLLFINSVIMIVCVVLSITVIHISAIIGIVITSILFVLPIFKR